MTVRDLGTGSITCAMTAQLANVSAGAFTVAAVARKTDTDWRPMVSFVNDGGSPRRSPWCSGDSDRMSVDTGGSDFFAPTTAVPGDGWCLLVWGKPAGEAALVCSKLVLSTGVWTHNSGDTMDDNSSTPDGEIHLGAWQSFRWESRVAAIAAWTEHLDQSAREALAPGLSAWLDAEPDALWPLTQESIATPVEDVTGNGSDQTAIEAGTSVVTDDDPPNFSLSTDDTPSEGTATLGLGLALSASGARDSAGTSTAALGLSLAASGSRPSAGTGSLGIGLTLAATGARPSTGTAEIRLGLRLSAAGPVSQLDPAPPEQTWAIPAESRTVTPSGGLTHAVEREVRRVSVPA